MSKETAVIMLGVWIIVIPQLGIPSPWRTALLVLSGIALIIIGLYLRAESHSRYSLSMTAGNSEHESTDGINRKV